MAKQRARIEDVAEAAGVSTATVSRVLNKTGPVAATTATKVYEAVAALEYVPHTGAQMLAGSSMKTLGVVIPSLSEYFFTDLLRGIEQASYENGYQLLVFTTHGRSAESNHKTIPLGHHNTDGLIVFSNSLSDAQLSKLHQSNFPLVLLHQLPPPGTTIPSVTFQNKEGARQLVEHLLSCGHRRIAFLSGPEGNEDSYCRQLGYEEALEAAGIEVDEALIGFGNFEAAVSETAVSQMLAQGIEMDAIFAGDDEGARGVMTAVAKAGLRVPQDIAIVGFDDTILAPHLTPPLTTVRAPIEQAGHTATTQLIELIQTGAAPALTLLPTKLIIRQSCGCG